jgi:hypothetical protein
MRCTDPEQAADPSTSNISNPKLQYFFMNYLQVIKLLPPLKSPRAKARGI